MFTIEQIAFETTNMDETIRAYAFLAGVDPASWVRDDVEALHLYYPEMTGRTFAVALAFNYTHIPTRELELIQQRSGHSCQLMSRPDARLAHVGYHTADEDNAPNALVQEIAAFRTVGCPLVQLSATLAHTGTKKRYAYAFVDTRTINGVYTKIIQRRSATADDTRATHEQMVAYAERFRAVVPEVSYLYGRR